MASMVPAQYGVAYTFYVALTSQANTKIHQVNPTTASGDWKVSKDGGALANLTTLPAVTPAGSTMLKIDLSATEMQADNVTVVGIDASGSEWCSLVCNIMTSVRRIDDLAYPTTSGRALDVTATGAAGIDWGNVENTTTTIALTGTTAGLIDNAITAAKIATDAIDADAIADGAITSGVFAAGAITAAAIATNAIDDDALAADAVTAIQSGLSTLDAGGVRTAVGLASANLDTQLAAIESQTDDIGIAGAGLTALGDTRLANLDATISSRSTVTTAQVNSEVDTALADYDAPTFAELDARTDAIDSALTVIAAFLDTEIAAILADTNELQTDWVNGGRLDLLIDAIKVVTDALTSAAATKLALSAGTIVVGAAIAGTLSTTAMTTNLTEATDDHYNGRIIIWTSGVLINQATDILDYNGTTKMLTYTAVTEAPTAADTFLIV